MNAQTLTPSPAGWLCGSTGGGAPKWTLEADPSGVQVLKQSGRAPFPWCVKPETQIADGFVEVRFKPLAGKEDQAGGVVWRWQDGDNYYVARANALENNVSLYYTTGGRRTTFNTWMHRWRPIPGTCCGPSSRAPISRCFWMERAISRPTTATSRPPAKLASGRRPIV